jgi:hypothetical protein
VGLLHSIHDTSVVSLSGFARNAPESNPLEAIFARARSRRKAIRTPSEIPQQRDTLPGHFLRGRWHESLPGGRSRGFVQAQLPNTHRIQMNVTRQVHRPFVGIHHDSLEPTLEEMAAAITRC